MVDMSSVSYIVYTESKVAKKKSTNVGDLGGYEKERKNCQRVNENNNLEPGGTTWFKKKSTHSSSVFIYLSGMGIKLETAKEQEDGWVRGVYWILVAQ